jgi:protein SCO1/2
MDYIMIRIAVAVTMLGLALSSALGQDLPAGAPPVSLSKVGIDQKLDSQVPLDLQFFDENGKTVRLGDFFGQKPVVLSLVYYECPMLCTLVLNGMVRAFRTLSFNVGDDFEVVTVSFNPRETPALAAAKKAVYLKEYGRPGAGRGWHFLTGREDQIKQLTDAVGYRYVYDPKTGQYAHATGIMVLTPKGRVARYFYGIEYSPRDLRLGLIEATNNRIGSPVDQILLYCVHYDPTTGKYGLVIMNVIRLVGAATVLLIGGFIAVMLLRERAAHRRLKAEPKSTSA